MFSRTVKPWGQRPLASSAPPLGSLLYLLPSLLQAVFPHVRKSEMERCHNRSCWHCAHMCTHTCAHRHMHAHTGTCMHTQAHAHTGMCTHRHTGSWAMLWDWGLLLTKGSSPWVSLLPSFLFSFCSLCFSRISLSLLPPFLVFTSYHLGIYVYSFESLNKGEKKASL